VKIGRPVTSHGKFAGNRTGVPRFHVQHADPVLAALRTVYIVWASSRELSTDHDPLHLRRGGGGAAGD